jgi:4-hydroxybenzoate polyprenyltransferase
LPAAIRAIRPHQWTKNLLVFLPLVGAHRLGDAATVGTSLLAFIAFDLVASAAYVVNDLRDLEADRAHPEKRRRPFASGELAPWQGTALVALLLAGGAAIAALLPGSFSLLLAGYLAASLAYSFGLKRQVALDVLLLAGLYTARMFAGGFASGVPVSEWLASFAMFLFLSLAFAKRASELVHAEHALPGRGYRPEDAPVVFNMGIAAGYLSVLVLALYVSSHDVRRLYARPAWLWALCPLLLYWVSRLWVRARRGEIHQDPLVFALRDPVTWAVGAVGALAVFLGV